MTNHAVALGFNGSTANLRTRSSGPYVQQYTIAIIDGELAYLKARQLELYRIRNSLVPAMSLPAETWSLIVRYILVVPLTWELGDEVASGHASRRLLQYGKSLVRLGHICSSLRRIVLGNHGLWSVLACNLFRVDELKLFLQRTGGHPVCIQLGANIIDHDLRHLLHKVPDTKYLSIDETMGNLDLVLSTIGPEIEELNIEDNDDYRQQLVKSIKYIPHRLRNLRALRYRARKSIKPNVGRDMFPHGLQSSLNTIQVRNCAIPWMMLQGLNQLTHLSIFLNGEIAERVDPSQWRAILTTLSSSLQILSVKHHRDFWLAPPSPVRQISPGSLINMGKLHQLDLDIKNAAAIARQMSLSTENAVSVRLHEVERVIDWIDAAVLMNRDFAPSSQHEDRPAILMFSMHCLVNAQLDDNGDHAARQFGISSPGVISLNYSDNGDTTTPPTDFTSLLKREVRECVAHLYLCSGPSTSYYDCGILSTQFPNVSSVGVLLSNIQDPRAHSRNINTSSDNTHRVALLPEWADSPNADVSPFPYSRTLYLTGYDCKYPNEGHGKVLLDALRTRSRQSLPVDHLCLDKGCRISRMFMLALQKIIPQISVQFGDRLLDSCSSLNEQDDLSVVVSVYSDEESRIDDSEVHDRDYSDEFSG